MTLTATGPAEVAGPVGGPASVDYGHIPHIPRRWRWKDHLPVGNPVLFVAAGGTGKGMLTCLIAARIVLGLPFPDEDQATRYPPGRVLHIAGSEDDQFEDLAPRFRAAVAAAVAEFGLDPGLAGEHGAIRLIRDLSEWPDGSPFEIPADCRSRLAGEIGRLNADGGPAVALVVIDPLADMLGEKDTISSVKGARRVLRPVKRAARMCDVAMILVHHLTKDGKVSGSPAVVDALRLAFRIERAPDDETARVITSEKTNIADGQPLRYRITGQGPDTRAEFIAATDARAERVTRAAELAAEAPARAEADVPAPGSLRARMASVTPAVAEVRAGVLDDSVSVPEYLSRLADPGPFTVLRGVRPADAVDSSHDVRKYLGRDYATRADAWRAVTADCGAVLAPVPMPGDPCAQLAGAKLADGSRVAYVVKSS